MTATEQYWLAVALVGALGLGGCHAARVKAGAVARWVGRAIALMLTAAAVAFVVHPIVSGSWTAHSSLPLNICDIALVIAAVTCWFPNWRTGVELTYFWGLAGTLQAVATPDLSATFPQLAFFEFVIDHVGIVIAVVYLVYGCGAIPRRWSAVRVFVITLIYTAFVAVVDRSTGANYMYLGHKPAHASLLSVLGPWPWYIVNAAWVAALLFAVLDAPFVRLRAAGRDPASHTAGRVDPEVREQPR